MECWKEGRMGNRHEMAKQNSPGLQPWVRPIDESALKVAAERASLPRVFGTETSNVSRPCLRMNVDGRLTLY
jgi:hypothetical protein